MDNFLEFATNSARLTGERLMGQFRLSETVNRATPKEIKTSFDRLADELIKSGIEKNFPDHSCLTEETGLIQKEKDYLWIIDPLDGTGNFMNSNPFFAVSISLWFRGEPLLGVIEAPALKERYIAVKGRDARITDTLKNTTKKAHVSDFSDIEHSYIVYCDGGSKSKKSVLGFVEQIYPLAKDCRILGSAAIELAWVGSGRAEAYITPEISIWDISAGILFVHEAGGKIMNFNLAPYKWADLAKMEKINLVASNGKMALPGIKYL